MIGGELPSSGFADLFLRLWHRSCAFMLTLGWLENRSIRIVKTGTAIVLIFLR